MLTGCAAQQPVMPAVIIPPAAEMASAALCFDAPITLDQPAINLSRATRGPAAFIGFESTSVSYYDIVSDNRESTGWGDGFVRESFTERVGSTHR